MKGKHSVYFVTIHWVYSVLFLGKNKIKLFYQENDMHILVWQAMLIRRDKVCIY